MAIKVHSIGPCAFTMLSVLAQTTMVFPFTDKIQMGEEIVITDVRKKED